jgi:pimeloyl-ACP methyl ester carboxylesterase
MSLVEGAEPVAADGAVEGEVDGEVVPGPPLPLGRRVVLPGRGTTFVREVPGPEGAPTVLLLHGWMASGGLNWFRSFDVLGQRYRVLAPDHRGHGRGIRSRRRFRLADCADDAAVLLEQLAAGPAIVVGYSLGGPVAQLLWRRHPDLVQGLVLAATSNHLMPGMRAQALFGSFMAAAAGTTRMGQAAMALPTRPFRGRRPSDRVPTRPETMRAWARAEMQRHDPRQILEAGVAMSNYRARWIDQIDVPTVVLVTTRDRAVNPFTQLRMAMRIPGADIHRIDDGHVVCAKPSFGPALGRAVDAVAARSSSAAAAS